MLYGMNGDCIIYNEYGTGTARRMIKHHINPVRWEESKGFNVIRMGQETANSTQVYFTPKQGYVSPQQWTQLTIEEALSGEYFTVQKGDRMIKGNPLDAPETFTSSQKIDEFFGTEYSHPVMSVDIQQLTAGSIDHFEIGLR